MIGPSRPIDKFVTFNRAFLDLGIGDCGITYLEGRKLMADPDPWCHKEGYWLGRELASRPSYRLHGYDLICRAALAEMEPILAEHLQRQAIQMSREVLRAYLRHGEKEGSSGQNGEAAFLEALCPLDTKWDPNQWLMAEPLAAEDPLLKQKDFGFEAQGKVCPVVKSISQRLAQASAFLAVNGTGEEVDFDAQPHFLWQRLVRFVRQESKQEAYDLALDAVTLIKQGCVPVGYENDLQGARIGRDRVAIRVNAGPCLHQTARGLVLTL